MRFCGHPPRLCTPLSTVARGALEPDPSRGGPGRLRPYQKAVIEQAAGLYYGRGKRRLLFPIATGLGKTVLFTHLPQAFPELRRRGTVVLVHRDELVTQVTDAVRSFLPDLRVAVEKGRQTCPPGGAGTDMLVASVQTLGRGGSGRRRLERIGRVYGGVVVVDEAHHLVPRGMYDNVLGFFGLGSRALGGVGQTEGRRSGLMEDTEMTTATDRLLAGFTATPYRADGQSLRPFFEHSVSALDLEWGVSNGYLVDVHAFQVRTRADLAGVPTTRMQEFAAEALSVAINTPERNHAVARALLQFGAHGTGSHAVGDRGNYQAPRSIAFCASVRHAHDLAEVLRSHGLSAAALDGTVPKQERADILEAFRGGEISAVTNCNVLTEGFDAPACNTVVMCRPTKSKPLYMQMLGRGMRTTVDVNAFPGDSQARQRRALIAQSSKPSMHLIDFADNCGRHKVVHLPSALGLSPDFEVAEEGISLEVLTGAVGAAYREAAAAEAQEVSSSSMATALEGVTSLQALWLLVKRFRLLPNTRLTHRPLHSRQDVEASGKPEEHPEGGLSQLMSGQRIGMEGRLMVLIEDIIMPGTDGMVTSGAVWCHRQGQGIEEEEEEADSRGETREGGLEEEERIDYDYGHECDRGETYSDCQNEYEHDCDHEQEAAPRYPRLAVTGSRRRALELCRAAAKGSASQCDADWEATAASESCPAGRSTLEVLPPPAATTTAANTASTLTPRRRHLRHGPGQRPRGRPGLLSAAQGKAAAAARAAVVMRVCSASTGGDPGRSTGGGVYVGGGSQPAPLPGRFVWRTLNLADTEREPLHPGCRYLLRGTVQEVLVPGGSPPPPRGLAAGGERMGIGAVAEAPTIRQRARVRGATWKSESVEEADDQEGAPVGKAAASPVAGERIFEGGLELWCSGGGGGGGWKPPMGGPDDGGCNRGTAQVVPVTVHVTRCRLTRVWDPE